MTERPTVTILCVEDEPDLLDELLEELRAQGYRAIGAASSLEAMRLLESELPDIVICDVMIPGQNGFEFLKELREHKLIPDTLPFIFLTAMSSRDDQVAGRRAGCDDYLVKPIDLDILLASIENRLAFIDRLRQAGMIVQPQRSGVHLSRRETEVLTLLGRSARTSEIAHILGISEHTVTQYIKELYRKLDISSRAEAVRVAITMGLVGVDQQW